MNKRFIFLFSAFLVSCGFLLAQPVMRDLKPTRIDNNSVLWKVSGNGLKQASYLFGTIHAVPENRFVINDSIKKYLNLSKAVVLEADVDVPLKEQIDMAKKMILPGGKSIKDYMDAKTYNELCSYLKDSLKISESKIEKYFKLKPLFLSSVILVEVIGKPKAYDLEIQKMARKKKDLVYLETIAEQMSFMDSIPIEQQVPKKASDYKIDKEYFELLNVYEKQDLSNLDSLFKNDVEFKNMEDQLLIKRNKKWIPKILELMYAKPTFVAVGCGHLVGDHGLIELLRAKGYTLEPIYFTNKK